jgi:aspartate/methionine/tyrosine aminotransferase
MNSFSPIPPSDSFYFKLENLYNDNPMARETLLANLDRSEYPALPMTPNFGLDGAIDLMRSGLRSESALLPLLQLVEQSGKCSPPMKRRKLSPGVSFRPAPLPLTLQQAVSTFSINDAANYSAPRGQTSAVNALRRMEGLLMDDPDAYPPDGIFITEGGGTNGIYTAMRYIAKRFAGGEILALGPSYFQFFENAVDGNNPARSLLSGSVTNSAVGTVRFLPSVTEIEAGITECTQVLVITQPNNPTGEYYSDDELKDIINLAIERDIYILEDGAFEELVFPAEKASFKSVSQVANEMGVLDRVICNVKSYSKGKNLPGLRLGYLASANRDFIQFMSRDLWLQRDCPGKLKSGTICLDSILRSVELALLRGAPTIESAIEAVRELFDFGSCDVPINPDVAKTYLIQRQTDMNVYKGNFDYLLNQYLGGAGPFRAVSQTRGAYNTFLRLDSPSSSSQFEIAQRLFTEQGLETQWGPSFDNNDARWESEYGLWLRVTCSTSVPYLRDSIERLTLTI